MRERPILFNGDMVRAILKGRKSMTRRVVTHRHQFDIGEDDTGRPWPYFPSYVTGEPETELMACPYGVPGDRLWVRETFRVYEVQRPVMGVGYELEEWPDRLPKDPSEYEFVRQFAADGHDDDEFCRWRPSIHMPRWASRLLLEITDVRVERLQEISHLDRMAEGVQISGSDHMDPAYCSAVKFRALWDRINAARGYGWDANPWVWCVAFRRIEP